VTNDAARGQAASKVGFLTETGAAAPLARNSPRFRHWGRGAVSTPSGLGLPGLGRVPHRVRVKPFVTHSEQIKSEAVVVIRIYRDAVAGVSQMAIARALNQEGCLPPVRRCPGKKSKGQWAQSSICGILINPVYMGKIRHKGKVYDGKHVPIIDEETWQAAQRVRGVQTGRPNNSGGRWPKGPRVLCKGLLRCGTCGQAMIPRLSSRGDGFYACDGRRRNGAGYCAKGTSAVR
jgi:recombinase/recombinase-like zinc beta ribbon protein